MDNIPYTQHDEHQIEQMVIRTIEITILLSLLSWLVRRMFNHPKAALVFIVFGALAVWVGATLHNCELIFYPLALVALIGLGRAVR